MTAGVRDIGVRSWRDLPQGIVGRLLDVGFEPLRRCVSNVPLRFGVHRMSIGKDWLVEPIFVAGCGRSGTTMLATMLGRELSLPVPPEAQFLVSGLLDAHDSPRATEVFIESVVHHRRIRQWLSSDELAALRPVLDEAAGVDEVMALLVHHATANPGDVSSAWLDHTPENIMHVRTLLGVFPDALVIHIVRDPRAVASSVRKLDWGPTTARGVAEWWMAQVAAGLAAEIAYPDRVMRVKYEDVVSDGGVTLSGIVEWVRRSVEPTVGLSAPLPHKLTRYTRGQHRRVGLPPDVTRIDAWMADLSASDVRVIEGEVGDLLPLLGYQWTGAEPPLRVPKTAVEVARGAVRNLARRPKATLRRLRGNAG